MSNFSIIKDCLTEVFDLIDFKEAEATLEVGTWLITGYDIGTDNDWHKVNFNIEALFSYKDFEPSILDDTGEDSFVYELKQRFVTDTITIDKVEEARYRMSFSASLSYT